MPRPLLPCTEEEKVQWVLALGEDGKDGKDAAKLRKRARALSCALPELFGITHFDCSVTRAEAVHRRPKATSPTSLQKRRKREDPGSSPAHVRVAQEQQYQVEESVLPTWRRSASGVAKAVSAGPPTLRLPPPSSRRRRRPADADESESDASDSSGSESTSDTSSSSDSSGVSATTDRAQLISAGAPKHVRVGDTLELVRRGQRVPCLVIRYGNLSRRTVTVQIEDGKDKLLREIPWEKAVRYLRKPPPGQPPSRQRYPRQHPVQPAVAPAPRRRDSVQSAPPGHRTADPSAVATPARVQQMTPPPQSTAQVLPVPAMQIAPLPVVPQSIHTVPDNDPTPGVESPIDPALFGEDAAVQLAEQESALLKLPFIRVMYDFPRVRELFKRKAPDNFAASVNEWWDKSREQGSAVEHLRPHLHRWILEGRFVRKRGAEGEGEVRADGAGQTGSQTTPLQVPAATRQDSDDRGSPVDWQVHFRQPRRRFPGQVAPSPPPDELAPVSATGPPPVTAPPRRGNSVVVMSGFRPASRNHGAAPLRSCMRRGPSVRKTVHWGPTYIHPD
eukprot:TRINITY_DN8611_c0_g1_i1.p1 TRINITY_DN8611_c0_g1~~TRINITY_DN8611_c0_g1_i1.p1  ORF type:complete len:584 (+),score=148.44 TRINITY_DN8611_c0_g1_i1:74-1753(+)